MSSKTIHNAGFKYCCGHRGDVGGVPTKLYIELQSRGLVSSTPDLDRPLNTVCPACWLVYSDLKLFLRRAQVLRTRCDKEQSHSLLVLLHHLADRLMADQDRHVHLSLLAHWAQRVAEAYPAEHLDAFRAAVQARPVGAAMHRLVVEDALLSIQRCLAPRAGLGIPGASSHKFNPPVARFDQRARNLLWSVWRPWPAVVGTLLSDIARAGVHFAAEFRDDTNVPLPPWDGRSARPRPYDDFFHADHSNLIDAVQKFKMACYALEVHSTLHPMVGSRNELKAVIKSVGSLDKLFGDVHQLHAAAQQSYRAYSSRRAT